MLLNKAVSRAVNKAVFQWAPTLGGECYANGWAVNLAYADKFQWAPTLGGECYD